MTYSASQESKRFGSNKSIRFMSVITRVVKILENFTNNYEKRLNFTKLARYLNLNPFEIDEVIVLILKFQELFTRTFDTYNVKKKIINNQIFLITEPKKSSQFSIPRKIKLSFNNSNLLSDIIYIFKFVKRGNGFDIETNGTELLSNLKELCNYHPYFFEVNNNGLIYPSEFGLKLGELILSYNKSGKVIDSMHLDNHIITVEKN